MAYHIYLVDDDQFLLNLYETKFTSAGHELTTFGSAEELLAELRKGGTPPDAVVIDIIMPGIDGFAALETIHKEQLAKGAKFIVLSNQGQDTDKERCRALGVDGYITKASAIPSEVLAEVVRIIGKGRPTHTRRADASPATSRSGQATP
ncbi:MAG: response regulator [bacterium]|nr:response regulator [bacterium]